VAATDDGSPSHEQIQTSYATGIQRQMLAFNLDFRPIQQSKLTFQKGSSLPRTLAPRLMFFAESTPADFALSDDIEPKMVSQ
jgi:hypothetical protein